MKDIAFEILKHHYFPESRKPHKLKVLWWNIVGLRRKDGLAVPMGFKQWIDLKDEQWVTRTRIPEREYPDGEPSE